MIDDDHAGSVAKRLARLRLADRGFELDAHGLAMADEYRNPDAGRMDRDVGIQDLPRLDGHLPLFLGGAVIHEYVDVRNHVERDLLGEGVGPRRLAGIDPAGLFEQLVHGRLARPRGRLVGGDHDPGYAGEVV